MCCSRFDVEEVATQFLTLTISFTVECDACIVCYLLMQLSEAERYSVVCAGLACMFYPVGKTGWVKLGKSKTG